ncbi:hypothetical protein BV20DRAFT_959162, partial [Pilatotrama ljubarskyi]
RPQNYKELYNLRHATAWNIAERILGISKCKFPLVTLCPEYDERTQAKLVCTMAALFNFVRSSSDSSRMCAAYPNRNHFCTVEGIEVEVNLDLDVPNKQQLDEMEGVLGGHISQVEKDRADARHERIAQKMWEDYVTYVGCQQ